MTDMPNFWWCPTHHLYRGGIERPCAEAVKLGDVEAARELYCGVARVHDALRAEIRAVLDRKWPNDEAWEDTAADVIADIRAIVEREPANSQSPGYGIDGRCCKAGAEAFPRTCPWHGHGRQPLGDVIKCQQCGRQTRSISRGCSVCGLGKSAPAPHEEPPPDFVADLRDIIHDRTLALLDDEQDALVAAVLDHIRDSGAHPPQPDSETEWGWRAPWDDSYVTQRPEAEARRVVAQSAPGARVLVRREVGPWRVVQP